MNPWEILAWVAALSIAMVVVALAMVVLVALVGTLLDRKPKYEGKHIMRGERR